MKFKLQYKIFPDGVWRTHLTSASIEELKHEGEVMRTYLNEDLRIISASGTVLWISTPPAASSAGRQRRAGKRRS